MIADTPELIAASLLAARPRRGRATPEPEARPSYPRVVKAVAARTTTRVEIVNDMFTRAAAARLRFRWLRLRQAAQGVVWNDQKQATA